MIKAIITDIEGTTSSLSFVKDVLFPYSRTKLPEFVEQHKEQTEIAQLLNDVAQLVGKPLSTDEAIAQLIQWIDEDQKITPLKTLQGLIWQHGYQQGDFKGHIYPDAAEKLKAWHEQGIALYVYSSGSVHAQKLLFAHTEFGDLTSLLTDYFDTRIGGKKETLSYQRIAEKIALPTEQLLFLSDIKEELDAAKQAGLNTLQLLRGSDYDGTASHVQVNNFAQIQL